MLREDRKQHGWTLGVARYSDVTVRYVPRFGVTVRYDFGTTGEKKRNLLCSFLFIYFEQTIVQIFNKKVHVDVKILIINTNTIITLCYIISNLFCFHCECTQIKADLYPVIINKTISV